MGKIVLVTGASRGLGKAIALALAEASYDLWITYQSREDLAKEVQEEIWSKGVNCRLMKFDVKDEEESSKQLQAAIEEEGVPWGLINNAGITDDGLFVRMNTEQWNRVVATGLNGFFNVTKPVLTAMLKKKEGRVVNISSVVGMSGNPGQVNYASTKAGLIGATKSLALEVARRNILVNCIAPGFIETDMTENLNIDDMKQKIPLGRLGQPKDIASIVLFLLNEENDYITGQTLSVNGGLYQ